jgi:DTW domain-containing protein YfiP
MLPLIAPRPHRPMCATCLRPQSACLCHWVRPTAHSVEVVILQHPLEVTQAKGSARLLHLSLQRSRLVTGEVFEESTLHALLTAPFEPQSDDPQPPLTLLLYPDTPSESDLPLVSPPVLEAKHLEQASGLRLVVLDGTWRKSRKMLYLNPLLQSLPRLALRDLPPSHYLIRKAHRPDQRSTLEATCAALAQLEGDTGQFAPLMEAFDGFVAQQAQRRGPD